MWTTFMVCASVLSKMVSNEYLHGSGCLVSFCFLGYAI